jgi:hypothetical protein
MKIIRLSFDCEITKADNLRKSFFVQNYKQSNKIQKPVTFVTGSVQNNDN